jgi:copper chaperone CopZ
MHRPAACLLIAGTVLFAAAGADEPAPGKATQKVRLHVSGAYCQGCAEVLTDALSKAGVKNASKVAANRGRGYVIVLGEIDGDLDLGELAASIDGADTPHKAQARPGVALELFAPLDDESAKAALTALAKIKGVAPKGSKADTNTGTLSVKLAAGQPATVESIIAGLKDAGIEAQVVTDAPATEEKAVEEKAAENKE